MKKEKEKKKKRKVSDPLPPEQTAASPEENTVISKEPHDGTMDSLQFLTSVIGGKWKLRILWSLRSQEGVRYSLIKAQIPGITDMMLSQSLRELSSCGLVERCQFQEIPPRVEYHLTPMGMELLPHLSNLVEWAQAHQG